MVYSFGLASGCPGQKKVKVPVFYRANREVDAFTFEMEIDSTKLSFADTAAIKGALIDSICWNPDYWGVTVNGNQLTIGCILTLTEWLTLPAESEGDPLFKGVLDVSPDITPPDSTLLNIKNIAYPPVCWYHGIDGIFYIHQEGCEEPPEYSQPNQFELEQNYPNPFNAATTLNYTLPQVIGERFKVKGGPNTSHLIPITLKVYNLLGQEVRTLVDKRQKPGTYRVTWDASEVASGVYFYRLEVKGDRLKVTETRKMVVIK